MFDFKNKTQSSTPFSNAKETLWKDVHNVCRKTRVGRFLGLPVCIASMSIDVTQMLAKFGETIVKGTANITAAPFNKKAKVITGIKHFVSLFPQGFFLAILPVSLIINGLYLQTGLLLGGAKFAEKVRADNEEMANLEKNTSISSFKQSSQR